MMKKLGIFLVFGILLIPALTSNSQALQQVSGQIIYQVQPGETKTLQWGLVSDEDAPLTLAISASGSGSELLSFPSIIHFAPHQLTYVNVTVTVPANHLNNVKLTPSIYATQAGATGGPTVINVRMEKVLTINIGNPPIETPPQPTIQVKPQNPTTPVQKSSTSQSPSSTTIVASPASSMSDAIHNNTTSSATTTNSGTKGGGCLIATAAYGTEMAPQIQQLRETRDNVLMKTQSGAEFMTGFNAFYYIFAPTVADWERENSIFKDMVRISITPLLTTLSILNYVSIHSDGEMLFYGISVILLNIGMYFVMPAIVIIKLRHRILKNQNLK